MSNCKECDKLRKVIHNQRMMVSGFHHGAINSMNPEPLLKLAKERLSEGEAMVQLQMYVKESIAVIEAQHTQIKELQEFIDGICVAYDIEIDGFFEKGKRVMPINNLSSEEYIKLHNKEDV